MDNQGKVSIVTRRYIFHLKSTDTYCVRVVSDVPEGLVAFEKQLLCDSDIDKASSEYLHEIDVSQTAIVRTVKNEASEDTENEKV